MNHSFSPQHSLTVEYIQTADAHADANAAIYKNDFTLIGFDQRGLKVPGVKHGDLNQIQKNCTILRLDDISDVVRSQEHLKQLQIVHNYSLTYNRKILSASSCQK